MGRLTLLFFKFFNHTNIEAEDAWTNPIFTPMEYDAAPSRICVLGNTEIDGGYDGKKWRKYEIGNKITLETAKNMGLYESDYNSLIDDNWICYQLENNGIQITSTLSQSLETSFVYLFEPNGSSWLNDISDTREYEWQDIRDEIGGVNGTVIDGTGSYIAAESKHNNLIMRSLPAKPSDPQSFVANELKGVNGISRGLNRIIEHKIFAVADIVQEFLGDNNEKHHITPDEKTDMSLLKYYGPQIIVPSWRDENHVTHSKKQIMAAEKVIISHDSITKYGLVNMVGTPVSAVSIPFLYSVDGADYLGASKSGYLPNGSGLCQVERILRISFDEGKTWVASDNTAMWPYVIDPCIINYTFNNTPKEKLIYQGKGIQIQGLAKAYATNPATKALFESGQPISLNTSIGEITLGSHIYLKQDNSIYNFSPSDSILLRAKDEYNIQQASSNSIVGTPEIKILFNYAKRAEWFDTLNSYTADIVRNIQLENGVITGIKLNGTHLIKVENGQVVVETINQVN